MMTSIRRRFTVGSGDPWAMDAVVNQGTQDTSELALDNTILLTRNPEPASNDVDMKAYYKGLVKTAISHGGWYQGHLMSIPWLRMTLAGLELRPIPAEAMWEGVQGSALPEGSDYGDLFPAEEPKL
jgi:hypothetical protein